MNNARRGFLRSSVLLGTGAVAGKTVSAQHEHHSEPRREQPSTKVSSQVVSVQTPDLPKLPWKMEGGAKVFHLTAEVVKREFLPGKIFDVWGFNGSMPGPTVEVNEGDRVRFVFHNNLPEPITVHWHGVEVPIAMDGVPFISQPPVEPGGMFTYEFTVNQNGTFFYHSHMAMQEMLGLIGLFIIHPRKPHQPAVHKDFGLILQEWAILPNNTIPNTMSMEFNWLTINGKAGPATTPLLVKLGERVRIRMVNLGMDHHPMHIHGNQFYVTGTEGGRIPESAWFPGNTVLVGVAQARDVEFNAIHPGDWMLHCHLPHHMMNQMVSMVGPMAHVGHGLHTGMGMEEGMGMLRKGHALSEENGPGLGRGMGMTTREKETSHAVGQHQQHQQQGTPSQRDERKKVPGYPQDDMMLINMDKQVAKPEAHGLVPGWTASLMGMMTLVRVLPPDKYEEVMAAVREGRKEPQPGHKHPGP